MDFASGINMLELSGQFSGCVAGVKLFVPQMVFAAFIVQCSDKSLTALGFILIMRALWRI
jgi:hypothetical protein